MLSVNGRISRDASRDDTTWLARPELNVGDVFNRQISVGSKSVDWNHVRLSEEGSSEINVQEGEWESAFWSKDRSSKSERRYRLVVRLKAIEYKEDCLCSLSSTSSLHPVVLLESSIIFLLIWTQCIGRPLPLDFTKTPPGKPCMDHLIGSLLQTPLLDHLVVTH